METAAPVVAATADALPVGGAGVAAPQVYATAAVPPVATLETSAAPVASAAPEASAEYDESADGGSRMPKPTKGRWSDEEVRELPPYIEQSAAASKRRVSGQPSDDLSGARPSPPRPRDALGQQTSHCGGKVLSAGRHKGLEKGRRGHAAALRGAVHAPLAQGAQPQPDQGAVDRGGL